MKALFKLHISVGVAALVLALLAAPPALAAAPASAPPSAPATDLTTQAKLCSSGAVSEAAVAACTAMIKSGQYAGDALATCYFDRALNYAKTQRYPLAIADLDQAIKLKPNFGRFYFVRGTVKQVMGDTAGGAADIAKAKVLDPSLAD